MALSEMRLLKFWPHLNRRALRIGVDEALDPKPESRRLQVVQEFPFAGHKLHLCLLAGMLVKQLATSWRCDLVAKVGYRHVKSCT